MAKAKPKQFPVEETALPGPDLETVQAYLAAHRAKAQAEEVLKKLRLPVRNLAKSHPTLFVDGARITVAWRDKWKYTPVIAGFMASILKAREEEQESGAAKVTRVEFPHVRELSKFTGQAIPGIAPGLLARLLGLKK